MVDIHCHILPGLDDGAGNMEEALMMAAIAADDGVDCIIATPHITWDGRPVSPMVERIQRAFAAFQRALTESHIPVHILPGAEVLCLDTTAAPPTKREFPCIYGGPYALVEFDFTATAQEMDAHIRALQLGGIHPIIAHPERYTACQRDRALAAKWVQDGCLLQLNKGSPLGQFGHRAKKAAHRMLQDKQATFLASDAHGSVNRSPRMRQVYDTLCERYGEEYLIRLTGTNPAMLLREAMRFRQQNPV